MLTRFPAVSLLAVLAVSAFIGALVPAVAGAQAADDGDGGMQLLPEGFDDSSFHTDITGGWRILNADSGEPDALALGLSTYFRFSRWEGLVGFDLTVREGRIALRADEYNEVSDWFHAVRRLRYGRKGEGRFYFLFGELHGGSGTVGHGTIVNDYHTVTDFNSRQSGLQIDLDFRTFGIETLVNAITAWNVTVLRAYLRPVRLGAGVDDDSRAHSLLEDLTFGVTAAVDWDAPETLTPGGGGIALNSKRNPLFAVGQLAVFGLDVDVPLVDTERFQLAAWADGVQIVGHGNGLFVGVRATIEIPVWDFNPLELGFEWRQLSRRFLPAYFDARYEIERYAFPTLSAATTRRAYLQLATATTGFSGSLRWGIRRLFTLRGTFTDYLDDRDNQLGELVLEASTAPDAQLPLVLSVSFIKRGVSSFADAFALDERALLRVSAMFRFSDDVPLSFGLSIERIWRVNVSTGRYEPLDAWYPWLSLVFRF